MSGGKKKKTQKQGVQKHTARHDQCIRVLGSCVEIKVRVIVVGVFSDSHRTAISMGIAELKDVGISTITLPAVNPDVDDEIHLGMPPINGIRIRIIQHSPISMPLQMKNQSENMSE